MGCWEAECGSEGRKWRADLWNSNKQAQASVCTITHHSFVSQKSQVIAKTSCALIKRSGYLLGWDQLLGNGCSLQMFPHL